METTGSKKPLIRTPDHRLRVFVSSTLQELAEERLAAREAIRRLRLSPVMFELGARPHPPRDLYRAYLEQSHIFVGIYWQRYGWVAPGEEVSGLEDEYRLAGDKPKLIYVKVPAPEREDRLRALLGDIRTDDRASYKPFSTAAELSELLENDLALLLTERFELSQPERVASPAPEPSRSNLPAPPTPLVGRERELEAVRRLVLRDDVRLVTLTGPGGIGKSRLALEVGAVLRKAYRDEVFFVPLASLTDPELVMPAIARAVGVQDAKGPPLEALEETLRDKRALLVVDNFEQLLQAAPALAELLATVPGLDLLVTSRALLRVSGEYEFPVPPLELPAKPSLSPFETLSRSEAVRLFVARAQAVKPDFVLTLENALVVAEIAYRLDGLPLAIELAAARVRHLPPKALLNRLEKRFSLLTGGARDLPVRQQTLKNAIDWSYDLLSLEERQLFAKLGVFSGGFTLEAAEEVCGQDSDLNIFDVLASILDKSLITQRDEGGEPRFGMLETIREYASEKLAASAEVRPVRDAHAAYYLALASAADAGLQGAQQVGWLDTFEREHDNFRAALEWTSRATGGDVHVRLVIALRNYWWLRGHFVEGRGWLTEALLRPEALGRTGSRAKLLSGASVMAWLHGDYEAAQTFLEQNLAINRELNDTDGVSAALGNLGVMAIERGDYVSARALLEEGLLLRRQFGDARGIAASLVNLGNVTMHEGDYGAAKPLFEEALTIQRELGDGWRITTALLNLGAVANLLGDLKAARAHFEEALRLAKELGDRESLAYVFEGFASLAAHEGQPAPAARLWGAAAALREAIGSPLPPSGGRALYEADVASARRALGEDAWQTAWQAGRAMTLDAALALTLEYR